MNKHDMLDAIGDIDPKYVKDAGNNIGKNKKVIHFNRYLAAAAGLLLVIVSGVVIRNTYFNAAQKAVNEPQTMSTLSTGVIEKKIPEADMNSDFDSSLIEFIEKSGFEKENFMISPTSFRAALALAVSGADKETKNELLTAMGFKDMNELTAWYKNVSSSVDSFNEWLKYANEDYSEYADGKDDADPSGAFNLENSIWKNTASEGELSQKYIDYVKENFGATASNVSKSEITDAVNDWVNENTNGLIPSIASDLSFTDLVLVNTLYLRTSWVNSFGDGPVTTDDFTTISGDTVKKEFMSQQERYRYYEDENCKFVVIPMNGGINAVFILGDATNVIGNIQNASFEEVSVKLPKFEVETTFSNNELVDFCIARGAKSAFSSSADFSLMSDDMALGISDIIQKTKIKVDEDGIEAAAATAIMLTKGFAPEASIIREFVANEPFKYMILTDSDTPELLFYGQLVE